MSIEELRVVATRWDLLTHGFYRRWVAGELSLDELEDYACQYHQVVKAIPGWMRQAAAGRAAPPGVVGEHLVGGGEDVQAGGGLRPYGAGAALRVLTTARAESAP